MLQASDADDGSPAEPATLPPGHGPRILVTAAASTASSAVLMGALFDVLFAVRRSLVEPSATMPILLRLAGDGPMRSCDLAERLHLDQSTVSRHVHSLEGDDLVRRATVEDDRRAHLLELTPSGRAAALTELASRVHRYEAAVADWSEHDQRVFARLLAAFAAGLTADHPTPDTTTEGTTA